MLWESDMVNKTAPSGSESGCGGQRQCPPGSCELRGSSADSHWSSLERFWGGQWGFQSQVFRAEASACTWCYRPGIHNLLGCGNINSALPCRQPQLLRNLLLFPGWSQETENPIAVTDRRGLLVLSCLSLFHGLTMSGNVTIDDCSVTLILGFRVSLMMSMIHGSVGEKVFETISRIWKRSNW